MAWSGEGKGKGKGKDRSEPYPSEGGKGEGKDPNDSQQYKKGDWKCEACGNHNFANRIKCNHTTCGALKPGAKEGDWICKNCRNHNYSSKTICNRCGDTRDLGEMMATVKGLGKGNSGSGASYGDPNAKWKPGDWECDQCGFHCFANAWECPQCKGREEMIGAMMDLVAKKGFGKGGKKGAKDMRPGDWFCPSCGNHNFAIRMQCKSCDAWKLGTKKGDWMCRCRAGGQHNFAKRMNCIRCEAPKPAEGSPDICNIAPDPDADAYAPETSEKDE